MICSLMYVSPRTVEAAKRCGHDNIHGQFTDVPRDTVRAGKVVDLLVKATSPGAQLGARKLLTLMSNGGWKVIANVHRSRNDPTPHIRVSVCNVEYHLRLDARGCVFDITYRKGDETIRLSQHLPYVRPGAAG
jgi:hypothetical protein